MVKLPKHESPEQHLVKEFVPNDAAKERTAGRLIIRSTNYGSKLSKFDGLFNVMAADALTCEPPIELERDDVGIVQYGGARFKRTFGMEVSIPEGHVVPQEYTRVQEAEYTL